jgi:NADH-quinone oxidoreductase subunit J
METAFFWLSTFLTVGGALMVAFSKNVMHACIFLLTCFLGVAGLYVTLSADFVAATQLMVYVGGVVILMIFAVMLTGGAQNDNKNLNRFGFESVPLMGNSKSFIVAGINVVVLTVIAGKILINAINRYQTANTTVVYKSTVEEIGIKLLTDHVLVFEISSVLLLGALIGASIVARPARE